MLMQTFKRVDSKSAKRTDDLSVIFALLGSKCVKVARKMLMKLTPVVVGKDNTSCQEICDKG